MNVLDENIPDSQRQLLRSWRIRVHHVLGALSYCHAEPKTAVEMKHPPPPPPPPVRFALSRHREHRADFLLPDREKAIRQKVQPFGYAYSRRQLDFPISYWRTASGAKVDLILGDSEVAIEIKDTAILWKKNSGSNYKEIEDLKDWAFRRHYH